MLGPIFMGVSHTWKLPFMNWNQQTADYYAGHCTFFSADIQQMSAELKIMKNILKTKQNIREVFHAENKNATLKRILWNGNSSEARTIILV